MTGRRGPRPTQERLHQLLILLPWLMTRGEATIEEIAERFGMRPDHVVRELELAACCGLPPYQDELIDLVVEDGRVTVGVPRLFTRPLRLTPREGFAVVAAGRAALALPGADPAGPLARALDKLEAALGARPVVSVELEEPPLLGVVNAAAAAGERLAITYRAGDDRVTERVIAPLAVHARQGAWYVVADCSLAGAERTFRIDRIDVAHPTGERFTPRAVAPPAGDWFDDAALPEAELLLAPGASWVVERYPVRSVAVEPDGRRRVVLKVTGERWLGRLLVQLGPDAEVVAPAAWRDLAARTAAEVLAAYRSRPSGPSATSGGEPAS